MNWSIRYTCMNGRTDIFNIFLLVKFCFAKQCTCEMPLQFLQDNLVLDTPRQRRQVRRYGNDHLEGEIVDMIDPKEDVIPSRGRHGWTKIELFKTEKWVLIYG